MARARSAQTPSRARRVRKRARHFGDRLKALRLRLVDPETGRPPSIEEVAKQVGISRWHLGRLESSSTPNLRVDTLLRLQKALECSTLEEFFGQTPSEEWAKKLPKKAKP